MKASIEALFLTMVKVIPITVRMTGVAEKCEKIRLNEYDIELDRLQQKSIFFKTPKELAEK